MSRLADDEGLPIDDLNACYGRPPIEWKTPLTWGNMGGFDNYAPSVDDLNVCYQRPPIRTFSTGSTRDTEEGKNDYEGFLSPLVIEAYGDYMTRHRFQARDLVRESDNWQKGIPKSVYIKSAWRHLIDLWKEHRGYESRDGIDEALGGLLFNIMGYWLEYLRERDTND